MTKRTGLTWGMVVLMGMVSGVASATLPDPKTVKAEFHTGYVPDGFDTNDNVEIVGEGTFTDSCFRPATPKVEVNSEDKTVTVYAEAYKYSGVMCLQMLVPYHQVLDLGLMKAGQYNVIRGEDMNSLGSLKVRIASNSDPDDYPYAPVSQAYYEKVEGVNQVKLSGTFTNSCMDLEEIRVDVQPKVIVLQPIARMMEGENCVEGQFPFEENAVLPEMPAGRYLLHVRSLNARSVNNLVDVQ